MKSFLVLFVSCQAAFCADYLTGQAARMEIGQRTFTAITNPGTPNANNIGGVSGIAFASDTLFVADSNKFGSAPVNNRVLLFTPVSKFPAPTQVPPVSYTYGCTVCVGTASVVVGQTGFDKSDPALTQTGLRTPTAVASDGVVMAVADTDNNRVLIWKSIPTSNTQPADVVIGQADFTHGATKNPPSNSSMRGPQGVWIANGKLFVADTNDNRILIYNTIPTSNGAAADVVLGQADFNSNPAPPVTDAVVPATQSNMASPVAVTSDGTHLFVADLGHNRILIWNSIPTANNQAADVELGQPDFSGEDANNSSSTNKFCPSNGTDSTGAATYPIICKNTLSFPRFALAGGGHFYVADGGNDRVLVYNSIPSANGTGADAILGQAIDTTDVSSSNTDGLQTPSSLAWDGTNLWVADAYNLRIVAYTPQDNHLPLAAVRNAASLQIYATGTVTFTGTPAEKDEIDLTIGTAVYKYTVVKSDTLANVVTGLVNAINAAPDPNVIALADTVSFTIFLTARKPGTDGVGTALSDTQTGSAGTTVTLSGATIAINLADASKIAAGSIITVNGTNLSDSTAAFDYSTPRLPNSLAGTSVYVDGFQAPLLYVSPTQINAQIPYEVQDRSSSTVYVVTHHSDGTDTATTAVGTSIVVANPGLFTLTGGSDPRPGLVFHYSANATGLISVDGTITAGDIGTITINGKQTYSYTVLATDTLTTVRDAFIKLMASDPDVIATASNEYTRIFLLAKAAGTGGNGIAYTATVTNTGATLSLSALTATLCCGNAAGGLVTTANPAAPGEVVYTYSTGLGVTTTGDKINTGVIVTGTSNPLLIPVDSILAGGKTANVVSSTLVPGTVGLFQVIFQLSTGLTTDPLTQLTIAQQDFVSNIVTFPVTAPATTP